MSNNSSSVSGSIGDIFFPDNPKRRARAAALKTRVDELVAEFNQMKSDADTRAQALRTKVDTFLKQHGYSSLADLDRAVRSKLVDDALDSWKKATASINKGNVVVDAIMSISGVAFAAGGLVIGGLVLFAVISGPVGWAVLGTLAAITGVASAIGIIIGIINSADERDKLRQAITDLSSARLQAEFAAMGMRTYRSWIGTLDTFLSTDIPDMVASASADVIAKALEARHGADMKKDFSTVTLETAWDHLNAEDVQRDQWMNEDPGKDEVINAVRAMTAAEAMVPVMSNFVMPAGGMGPWTGSASTSVFKKQALNAVVPMAEVKPLRTLRLEPEDGATPVDLQVQWQQSVSQTSCIALGTRTLHLCAFEVQLRDPKSPISGQVALSNLFVNMVDLNDMSHKLSKCTAYIV